MHVFLSFYVSFFRLFCFFLWVFLYLLRSLVHKERCKQALRLHRSIQAETCKCNDLKSSRASQLACQVRGVAGQPLPTYLTPYLPTNRTYRPTRRPTYLPTSLHACMKYRMLPGPKQSIPTCRKDSLSRKLGVSRPSSRFRVWGLRRVPDSHDTSACQQLIPSRFCLKCQSRYGSQRPEFHYQTPQRSAL